MAIPEPRAARAAARSGTAGHAAIKRVTVVGYRSATPRPATRRPAAARVSDGTAQNSTNPAAATPVHASIRTLWSGTRRMTIADIPRTVAMTVYGDLETSTLTELPAGRSAIATHVVPAVERPHYLERAWQRVREEVAAGRQAYVVCPRIGDADGDADEDGADIPEPSQEQDPALFAEEARRPPLAVLDVAPELAEGPLSGLRVGIMHGRLVPDEKDRVMSAFAAGELDVLVSTTVIEVGVDVPNATVMVIMDAERFGVSQLHQLRGRVGRGRDAGLCLLVTDAPPASPARERLDAVAATGDGFQLSRLDLQQRREGDVLGSAQAGRRSSLKLLRLLADEDLIATAREEAATLVGEDPKLTAHQALKEAIDDFLGDRRAEFLDKA